MKKEKSETNRVVLNSTKPTREIGWQRETERLEERE